MGVPVVPTDVEAAPSLQEQQEEDPLALTAGDPSAAAGTFDNSEIVLHHVESVGRPHDWWWALNNWRKRHAYSLCGPTVCACFEATLTSKYWLLFTVTITLFCLYAVDICDLSAGSLEARTVVSGVLLAIFILFSLDLCLSSIFVDKYLFSFFFWVDLIGTASLILDIQWFADGILNTEDSNALQITRAGRAARIGSQMGRITRVLRMVRALRLLKVLQLRKRAKHGMDAHGAGNGPIRPTVLGELLAESTTRKCVLIILFVLVVATFLQTYPASAADYDRVQLVSYGVMSPQAFVQAASYPVILMSYVDARGGGRLVEYLPYTRSHMRPVMQLRTAVRCAKYVGAQAEDCGFRDDYSIIWYDVTRTTQLNAGLNVVLTTVIIVCLGLSAYFFGRDATTYVIMPIETMLKYLKRMIMVGVDGDVESEHINFRKPPETDVLANYVSRLVNEIDNARWKAEEEARISDTLLNSMVPPRIARQLKELRWWEAGPEQRAQTIADSFPHATVLFTDIVGFTVLSSRISAEDAMRHLNNMYTIFDEIVEKYGLYKVETIGDSYMLVGGAPEERLDHAERVAAAALEIRGCVPLLQEMSGEAGINVRIGMHSGAVTAGVVGFKNPRWHLFGDTCNTASRMESTGIAGEIQLSCTTYELIRDRFQCKVRGKIAVKGKGEMVTYLLEREYGGADTQPDSPSGHGAAVGGGAALGAPGGGGGGGGGGDAMDREAFLASPQFKKAMERYTTARSSFLTEEEELCKLLKTLDETTTTQPAAAAATVAAGPAATAGAGGQDSLPRSPPPSPLPEAPEGAFAAAASGGGTTTEAVAAAGVVVPRLAVGLGTGAFKQLVLGGATLSDLKALALHMHEELAMCRAMMSAAEEDKAAGIRRDMLLKLYARVLEKPGMSLRDTFAAILDTLYKIIECDVIKMYVVDHARGQLWPVTRHSATDANRTLPLEGTLAGAAVRRARVVRVDDVAQEQEFNQELEELPAGYTSKSMMCVPVFSVINYHTSHAAAATAGHHARTHGSSATGAAAGGAGAAAGAGASPPGPGDVIAVLVMVNRWTPWREAGAEEDERRIVPFGPADEACVRDAAASVGLLLVRRRGEMLLASAVPPSCLAGASFSVAALPASVARQRLRGVARRSSVALLDTSRGNLWAMKQEELMGHARDVLSALQRRVGHSSLSVLGCAGEEALVSYLIRVADEQSAGRFFNLAHSVGVLQGIYLTLRTHTELAAALSSQHLLALVLAASLLNVDRDGELLPAVPTGAAAAAAGVGVGRTSRARAAAAAGLTPTPSRGTLQLPQPPQPPAAPQQQPQQSLAPSALPPGAGPLHRLRAFAVGGSFRNSEPGIVASDAPSPSAGQRAGALRSGAEVPSPEDDAGAAASALVTAAASPARPSASSRPASKQWSDRFASGPPSPLPSPAPALRPVPDADADADADASQPPPAEDGNGGGEAVAPRGAPPAALSFGRSRSSLPSASFYVPPPPPQPCATATVAPSQGVGGAAAAASAGASGGAATTAAAAAYYGTRNRAVSARRGRLAAMVDDILSGETNMLSALPHGEAAAVKATIVTLLALRNQPTTVLALPGLQPHRAGGPSAAPSLSAGAGVNSGSAGVAAAAAAALATATSARDGAEDAVATGGGGEAAPSSPPPTPQSVLADDRSSSARMDNGGVASEVGATTAAEAADDPTRGSSSRAGGGAAGGGDGSGGVAVVGAPLSLAALVQAAESDPHRLAEARTAVCALLLLTWSELLHVKDPGTALALLQGRATDARSWATRLAANVSGRRRTVSLLGAMDCPVEDVQSLLLLEVPRMQLEVIPLWQRTVELLPGLQPQLDLLHANRAAYVSMLQDTTSLPRTTSQYGIVAGGGAAGAGAAWGAAGGGGGGAGAASQQRGSAGAAAASAFWRPSLLRSAAALDGAPSGREPRRFISVKQRGSAALTRSILSVMPSGDSNTSVTAGGVGVGGNRAFVRASSSRSYAGRNGPEDYDADMAPEFAGGGGGSGRGGSAAASPAGSGGTRLSRHGGFAVNSAVGARSMRRTLSRGTAGGPSRPARLASLALQSNRSGPFATANGLGRESDGTALGGGGGGGGGSGQRTSGSNQSFVAVAQPQGSASAASAMMPSGFRPRSQTHDLGTAPSAAATAAAAAGGGGGSAPMSPSDASSGGGHRRGGISNRLNGFFSSFRASGRGTMNRPSHLSLNLHGAAVGDGGSAHAYASALAAAAVNSPVTGASSSPRPSPLFSGASPFELYGGGGAGYGAPYDGGALASQNSQVLQSNLALSAAVAPSSGAMASLSPAGSLPLPASGAGGGAGGWSDPQLTSVPVFPLQVQLLQPPQSPATMSPVTSWRRTTAPPLAAPTATATASAAVGGSSSLVPAGGGLAAPAPSAMVPAAPHTSPPAGERGDSRAFKGHGKLRQSILRRLSHVAAKLPFHTANAVTAATAIPAGSMASGSGAAEPAAGEVAPSVAAAAAGVEVSLRVSDGGGGVLLPATDQQAWRRESSTGAGSQQHQQHHFHSVPSMQPMAPAAVTPPSLLRAKTIPAQPQQPEERQLLVRQPRLSQPMEPVAAAPPPPPAQRRRVTAPSGALALAAQHEQYAATVAAAAFAFAARQAAAAAAAVPGDGTEGEGCDVGEGAGGGSVGGSGRGSEGGLGMGMGLTGIGPRLSLIGSGLTAGGALPTVAEFSGSGRNSSATGTARSNSTAAQGETPKHAAAAHAFSAGGSHGGGVAATPISAAVVPSRFGQAPAVSPHQLTLEVTPAAPPSPPPRPPALSPVPLTPGAAATSPPPPARLSTFAEAATTTTVGSSTSAASIAGGAFRSDWGSGGAAATATTTSDATESRVTPHHHVSSKGVWLGLRLATDVLRSMGRRGGGDSGGGAGGGGGGYPTANSGTVALESVLPLPESETPKFLATAGAIRSGPHGTGTPPPAAAGAATGIGSAGAGSSASGSRNPSRMQTPTASLRRGGAGPAGVGVGGVASLQAVIDMAEAALTGGGGGGASSAAVVMSAPYSPPRMEYRVSVGGTPTGPSRNQSHRRGPAAVMGPGPGAAAGAGAAAAASGVGGMAVALAQGSNGGAALSWAALDDAFSQRTSAPPAPSRFSLRRGAASRTFADQATAISAAPTLQPGQLPEQP